MDQQGLSREAAEKMVHKSDHKRKGFMKFAFHRDWDDPSLYDLIINRDKLSPELASSLIIGTAQSQEIRECSLMALAIMERRSLEKRIEATLLRNNINIADIHVEVPVKGIAHITGWTDTQKDKDRVFRVVQGVRGVTDVKSEISVVPPAYV
jgi:hypothetical protein